MHYGKLSKGLSLTLNSQNMYTLLICYHGYGKWRHWDLKIYFLEMNGQSVVDLNTKNGMSK